MKKLIIAVLLLGVTCVAYADRQLQVDGRSQTVQGFAPDGKKSQALTVYKTTVNMSNDIAWNIYAGAACKFRVMSTTTVVGMTSTLPISTRSMVYGVNKNTPFINFTGCTSSELLRH